MKCREAVGAREIYQSVFFCLTVSIFHLDQLRIGIGDFARFLGHYQTAGVARSCTLDACRHVRRVGHRERHGLFLHVAPHECAVGVVVLDERNERGRDGERLVGRDLHEIHVLALHERRDAFFADFDYFFGELPFLIARRRRVRDRILLFFNRINIDDLFGHAALLHFCIRRFDDAEFIGTRIERHVEHESDIFTFRCVNRTHAAVVR